MSYYLRSLFGSQTPASHDEHKSLEVIETLVERLQTSTVFEDRRDSLKALRSLNKKLRLHVTTIGLNVYLDIIEKEKLSPEIVTLTLEILLSSICEGANSDSSASTDDETWFGADELGERFVEIIVKKKSFIPSLIVLTESYDFNVRRVNCSFRITFMFVISRNFGSVIQLLIVLLRHRTNEVQSAIIEQPMGVSHLLQLLYDNREIIRNSAILMLCELSRANSQIQQLLAYENTFQLIFDITGMETIDSIVIEDCLFVLLNLLRKNSANQELFREASLIQRLASLLYTFFYGGEDEEQDDEESEWSKQRIANLMFLLQTIRSLVSPTENCQNSVHLAQQVISRSGLLKQLCSVFLSTFVQNVDLQTEIVISISEIIRGNAENQRQFASQLVGVNVEQISSITALLEAMTIEKQYLHLRCAVFYCFLCYLQRNEVGKTQIIDGMSRAQHLNPSENIVGNYIISAINSNEGIQAWMGCVCLMHCLYDADNLKIILLKLNIVPPHDDSSSCSLLHHLGNMLISLGSRKTQVRIGILMLLAAWLSNSSPVISEFLKSDEIIQYLTIYIDGCSMEGSETENELAKGLMALILAVCMLQGDDGEIKDSLNLLVERRIGKSKLIELLEQISQSEEYVRATQRPQPLAKYPQSLILDYQFTKNFKIIEGQLFKYLRPSSENPLYGMNGGDTGNIVASYKELIKKQDETIADLNLQIKTLNEKLTSFENTTSAVVNGNYATSSTAESIYEQSCTMDQFHSIIHQWQTCAERYQQWAERWQQFQVSQFPDVDGAINQLSLQVKELEEQLDKGWRMYESQAYCLNKTVEENNELKVKIKSLEEQLAENSRQTDFLKLGRNVHEGTGIEENMALKKEQEDLLDLIADQDMKINQYRKKLLNLGESVTEDDDSATELV